MKGFLRLSPVRLALVAAVVIAGLLALRLLAGGSSDEPSLESFAEVATPPAHDSQPETRVAVTQLTLDDLGAPDDPLPAALALPPIEDPLLGSQAAEMLARQIVAGGPDAFAALITALQASGIGMIGPENMPVVSPAEPWQGIAMQQWEVRLAAAMMLPERSVTLTLSDLAAFLVEVAPELQGAPLEKLLVDDLRAIAESPVPTRRFLGNFIAALGRNATSHAPYNLLGDVDPQTIELDGLQVSLILRRLATDVVMLAAERNATGTKKTASLFDALREWVAPTLHAQGRTPCQLSDRTQQIMDIAAFGSSMAWGGFEVGGMGLPGILQRLGLDRLGSAAAFVSTLVSYAQFIATYAALKADVTMNATPLVRTKKMSPQTGERRELTAIVRLNVGNAQMLNCFRAMLIAVGLDFSLANNGPAKGARVRWYGVEGFDQAAAALHGGGEAIVQFVAPDGSRIQGSGDPSSGANPITNATTGEDGKVQIGVEGRGQHEEIENDATEVNKSAKVRLHVALKGSDLFADLQEAAGTAAGGLIGLASLPVSILYRAQWASVGHHAFPVKDWRNGPAEWSGTISVVETTISGYKSIPEKFSRGETESQETETEQLSVEVTETVSAQSADGEYASLKGKASGRYNRQKTHASWTFGSCGAVSNRRMNNTSRESSAGSAEGDAMFAVSIQADGTYEVTANVPNLTFPVAGQFSGELEVFRQGCAVAVNADSRPHAATQWSLGGFISVNGRIDPSNTAVLSGTTTEEIPLSGEPQPGTRYKRVKTTTWQLRRN